jgi:diguanylate cyclase (GGDEF)-like protein
MGRLAGDVAGLTFEAAGALLCCVVFLFLYQQSRIVFFGLWALAWAVGLAAAMLGFELVQQQTWEWLAAYGVAGVVFANVLIWAGERSAVPAPAAMWKRWATVLRLLSAAPALLALFWWRGWPSRIEAYYAALALLLALVYVYLSLMLRAHSGIGARVFQISLLLLAAAPAWQLPLGNAGYSQLALDCLLAFSAMAMWGQSQVNRIRDLAMELDHVRREIKNRIDLDHLSGLFNQSALNARIEACQTFDGAVAVCDMDCFKEINDRYGHLVGDEILRHIGHLLQSSIRQEDEAFRWGGDEFVVLFYQQPQGVAGPRMAEIAARLREFQVRGSGVLPISFSWGTADGNGRPLREALDEADREMYQRKRASAKGQRATLP